MSASIKYLALLIVSLGTGLSTKALGAETNFFPRNFTASIGGFFGTTYSVELREGALFYFAADAPDKAVSAKVTPTAKQWREFRRSLDEIKIWQWRTNYSNPAVRDGIHWSLDIEYDDHELKTGGSNSFPGRGGKQTGCSEQTRAFSAYTAAVKRLLGGKGFQ